MSSGDRGTTWTMWKRRTKTAAGAEAADEGDSTILILFSSVLMRLGEVALVSALLLLGLR